MPVYLFTFHAYRSWMPDRSAGYVRRGEGVMKPDPEIAKRYADRATAPPATFTPQVQAAILAELRDGAPRQDYRVHAVAVDPTHVHVVVSWADTHDPVRVRSGIKSSITRRLKQDCGGRPWLSKHGSRKRVKAKKHFDHLVTTYLPSHRGLFWREGSERNQPPPHTRHGFWSPTRRV